MKTDRRGFAGMLGALALGPRVLAAPTPKGIHIPKLEDFRAAWEKAPTLATLNAQFDEPNEHPHSSRWNKWYLDGRAVLGWTGWKMDINSTILCSQWVATVQVAAPYVWAPEPKKRYFVSSTPGAAAEYQPGYVFDISLREGQPFLDWHDIREKTAVIWNKAACAKVDAFVRLDEFVRRNA